MIVVAPDLGGRPDSDAGVVRFSDSLALGRASGLGNLTRSDLAPALKAAGLVDANLLAKPILLLALRKQVENLKNYESHGPEQTGRQ